MSRPSSELDCRATATRRSCAISRRPARSRPGSTNCGRSRSSTGCRRHRRFRSSGRSILSAAVSVPTVDEKAWRATEPHTPNPRARLEAIRELKRAGIRTGVLIAPLMPGVNDAPHQVAPILELCAEAGVDYVTGIALHLRGEVRGLFFE